MILDLIPSERLRELVSVYDADIDKGELMPEQERHVRAMRQSAAAELTRRHHQGATEANPND